MNTSIMQSVIQHQKRFNRIMSRRIVEIARAYHAKYWIPEIYYRLEKYGP